MKTNPTLPLYRLSSIREHAGLIYDLRVGEYLVGSSRQADLVVPVEGVSRRHARFHVTPEKVEIEDLASTNGTHLDGARIEPGRAETSNARAAIEVRFGPVTFRITPLLNDDDDLGLVFEPPASSADPEPVTPEMDEPGEKRTFEETTTSFGSLTETATQLRFPAHYRPGASAPMRALYAQMESLLDGDLPLLVHGETGVGKELVARVLHDSSERRERPFVAVNCAAIPAELLEAEMFGIAKGVATGVDARLGKFRQAEGGTLFLDEVAEMAPALQAKLLRALQEKEIHPVGGRAMQVDVRVISATNVDLAACLESGALREDLYYRLAGFVLEVPPLRECRQDLAGLIETFARRFSAERTIRLRGMTKAALEALEAYPWPGNVRELEQEIRRGVYLSGLGGIIGMESLSPRVLLGGARQGRTDRGLTTEARLDEIVRGFESLEATASLALFEKSLVREALRRTSGNKSAASRLLGISRNGLGKKLKRLDVEPSEKDNPS